ncbi:MAG: type 4a pilus biogenesis protein PilO [Actinobacteria bacterium]|nr:type 4a pilus biogenesis protein PilO [Actinomycetota bacterium]
MNRQAVLVAVLVTALVVVAYYLFLLKPKMDEVGEVEEEIATVQQQEAQLRSRLASLEEVRARAPEIEAAIAATTAVLPTEPNLPAALRQLQLAADEAGARLITVAPARPAQVEGADFGVINVSVSVEGGYFQIVDFFRRVEDPSISPRAIRWQTVALAVAEYPTLTLSATGQMFVVGPPTTADDAATEPAPGASPGVVEEGQAELEGDIDAEVEDAA